mmetsp:Transcript_95603/g.276153  ORF Transcript_95603/g.276153 Transcript_95603/m.276153 type:complete len:397 (-) Transcript_95603:263-1453(-)
MSATMQRDAAGWEAIFEAARTASEAAMAVQRAAHDEEECDALSDFMFEAGGSSASVRWPSFFEVEEDIGAFSDTLTPTSEASSPPTWPSAAIGAAREEPLDLDGQEPLSADAPLLEVARQQPVKAARFLEAVLLSGSILGLILPLPCVAFFLSDRWARCGTCGRPLHMWVLVHCLLHFLQSPLRLMLLRRLRRHTGGGSELQEKVRRLTNSRAWRVSTGLSTAAYAWFVVGVVWLLNADFCKPCPDLYRLTLVVMGVAVLKPILTLVAFRYAFGCLHPTGEEQGEQRSPPKGASEELIASLPIELCQPAEDSSAEWRCSCAVCLCDFEAGECLRRLPCNHKFHKPCIDRWLRRNRVCPLCLHDAGLPPPRREPARSGLRQLLGHHISRLYLHSKRA